MSDNTTVLMKRQKYSEADKQKLVSEFEASGLGLRRFAKEVGIDPGLLSRWTREQVGPISNNRPSNMLAIPQIMPFDPFSIQDRELLSMNTVYNSLKDLKPEAVRRVLEWTAMRVLGEGKNV